MLLEKIELAWLFSFKQVFEHKSFKQAAFALNLPSSNVSRHVALLEEVLGLRLLERTTRRMSATEAGSALYEQVLPMLDAMDGRLMEIGAQGNEVAGHLKLLMPDLPLLAKWLAEFCVRHPRLSLSCDTNLAPTQGLEDGVDLLLQYGRGPLLDSAWVAKELARWPSRVVGAPQLITRYSDQLSLGRFKQLPCITSLSALNGTPWIFKDGRATFTLPVYSAYRVNSAHLAKEAALAGLGFAILPAVSCLNECQQGLLQEVVLEKDPEDLVLYAVFNGRHKTARKVTALLDFLTEKTRALPPSAWTSWATAEENKESI
ncbi:LysR family transcriptional regulator [Bowmanella yangjiangensis]|uniref:LysR family transcriptional regulator n=1 Tax=Bowmanella yangjiangensis TaxID=2811230 RepID=UPI001E36F738|nr:LysR family transcriptional regulator [Bowmanella yangjiangensis]